MSRRKLRSEPREPRPARAPLKCAYCDSERAVNREHCVARQFFPFPRPANLDKILVPSCRPCNADPALDEDYVRGLFSLAREGLSETGRAIQPTVTRGLSVNRGLRSAVARGLEERRLLTEAGIDLGMRMTQRIDWPRVERVVTKWVRGLYWKDYGEPLAPDVPVTVAMDVDDGPHSFVGMPVNTFTGWPGTFEYWHSRDAVHPRRSRWSFLFWGSRGFVAATDDELEIATLEAVE